MTIADVTAVHQPGQPNADMVCASRLEVLIPACGWLFARLSERDQLMLVGSEALAARHDARMNASRIWSAWPKCVSVPVLANGYGRPNNGMSRASRDQSIDQSINQSLFGSRKRCKSRAFNATARDPWTLGFVQASSAMISSIFSMTAAVNSFVVARPPISGVRTSVFSYTSVTASWIKSAKSNIFK